MKKKNKDPHKSKHPNAAIETGIRALMKATKAFNSKVLQQKLSPKGREQFANDPDVLKHRQVASYILMNDPTILMSHAFCQDFWGEEDEHEVIIDGEVRVLKNWEYHLMLMILEKDKANYLERFLV